MSDKRYVIAGSAKTADNYRKHKQIPRDKFKYISGSYDVCGLKNITIIQLYDFWDNSRAYDIMDAIEARGLQIKTDGW